MEEALKAATHPHDFRLLVASEGKRHTSYEAAAEGAATAAARRQRRARRTFRLTRTPALEAHVVGAVDDPLRSAPDARRYPLVPVDRGHPVAPAR